MMIRKIFTGVLLAVFIAAFAPCVVMASAVLSIDNKTATDFHKELHAAMSTAKEVTVTNGTGTGLSVSTPFEINIPASITLNWNADMTMTASDHTIGLQGEGTFTMLGGSVTGGTCSLYLHPESNITVNIKDGILETTLWNSTTIDNSSTKSTTINISGGTIKSTGVHTILNKIDNTLYVSGGLIHHNRQNTNSSAILNQSGGTVIINGGKIESAATSNGGAAIFNASAGTVTVTGGMISNLNSNQPVINNSGTFTVSGGFVFSHGSSINSIMSSSVNLTGTAVAVARSNVSTTTYDGNTRTNLSIFPNTATVFWGNHYSLGAGISYANGSNKGFFPVSGITVEGGFIVPPTGIADINASIIALIMLFALSITLWTYVLRGRQFCK